MGRLKNKYCCKNNRGELEYFKEFSPNYNPHTNTLQITYLSHDDNKQTYIEMNMKGNILKFKKFII